MILISGKYLIWAASLLMLACALLHALAWIRVQGDFAASSRPMAALLWFLLGIDWLVIAGLWALGAAQGPSARPSLLLSSVIPVAVAIGLCMTLGPRFFAVYLQVGAAALLLIGTLNLR